MTRTKSRARTALALVALLLAGLAWDSLFWILPFMAWLIALMGAYEIHNMGLHKGIHSSLIVALAGVTAFIIIGSLHAGAFLRLLLPVTLLLLMASFGMQMLLNGSEDAYHAIPLNFLGPFYVGLPLALGLQILNFDQMSLMYVLLAVWSVDVSAYYVGVNLGAHKLAPNLSPKKTWEGALGGLVGCLVISLLFKLLIPSVAFGLTWGEVFFSALLLGVFAQIGDLAESVLKRDAGVKDSGVALTGHGGVLDRIDSVLFSFSIFYIFLIFAKRLETFELIRGLQ